MGCVGMKLEPPTRPKAEICPMKEMFYQDDAHAIRISEHEATSVKRLNELLQEDTKNDLQRVRRIYVWITYHIKNAVDEYFKGTDVPTDSTAVLKSGRASSEGYANLFVDLCKAAKIKCIKITGFGKGFGHDPSKPFEVKAKPEHHWNILLLDSEARFVDCTWGAGYVVGTSFIKDFEEVYFLTDPDDFIHEHFPVSGGKTPDAQLLERPWDLDRFNRRSKIYATGLEVGLVLLSHEDWQIDVREEAVIKMKTSKKRLNGLMAELVRDNEPVQGYTFIRRAPENMVSVTVRPPNQGLYKLSVYGHAEDHGPTYYILVAYNITCTEVMQELHPYPKDYTYDYGSEDRAKGLGIAPNSLWLDFVACPRGEVDFEIYTFQEITPSYSLVYAEAEMPGLDRALRIATDDSGLQVTGRLPLRGYYRFTLLAVHANHHRFETLLNVLLEYITDEVTTTESDESTGETEEEDDS